MLDFLSLAASIVADNPDMSSCRPAIEKELLHLDILSAMHKAGFLQNLVFKGGTCLRLCYGGARLSEDLDFSGGEVLGDQRFLDRLESVLRRQMGNTYGLDVSVSVRKEEEGTRRTSSSWTARVITRPSGPTNQLAVQRIKIEVNKREPNTHESQLVSVLNPYRALQGYFAQFPIRAASRLDICTDKMVALPMSVWSRHNPRFRDIWDIQWLVPHLDRDRLIRQCVELAKRSVGVDEYRLSVDTTLKTFQDVVNSDTCRNTLGRFLPKHQIVRFMDPAYQEVLTNSFSELFKGVLNVLDDG